MDANALVDHFVSDCAGIKTYISYAIAILLYGHSTLKEIVTTNNL